MPVIGHPIGNIDEEILINDLYLPDNFQEGWYFLANNSPYYHLVSTDVNPYFDEVIVEGENIFVATGFDVVYPSGIAPISTSRYVVYPSGISPYSIGMMADYWKLFADLDQPYTFIPYFDSDTYGEIVYLDVVEELNRKTFTFPLKEQVLSGFMFPFKEQIVEDKSFTFNMKEKIISLLNCDIKILDKNKLKIVWDGDSVRTVEVLMKSIGEKDYGEPIASLPFELKEYEINIDDNSYNFTVRGANDSGYSLNEITVGLPGTTTMDGNIDLGDFVKIFEVAVTLAREFNVNLKI